MCAYSASKFAFEAFSDSLRLEVKPWDISVHIIEPTFYKTGMINDEVATLKRSWQSQSVETKDEITQAQFDYCKWLLNKIRSSSILRSIVGKEYFLTNSSTI